MRKGYAKKVLVISFILSIILGLSGCGAKKGMDENEVRKIDKMLQGTWTLSTSEEVQGEYVFKNGHVSVTAIVMGLALDPNEGNYTIDNSVIKIVYDNGVETEVSYVYENDQLELEASGTPLYKYEN